MKGMDPLMSSGKDDWETPQELFEEWNRIYHFILDAAANEINHKCERWFGPGGEFEDALANEAEWPVHEGNIWLNPPYSRPLQGAFVRKAADDVRDHDYKHHVVCLLPARTDTILFHQIIKPFGEITFLRGRVTFEGAENGAPFPSMIVVF